MHRIFHPALIATISLFSLAACDSPRVQWTKPGTTDADYQRDWQECGAAATTLTPSPFDARIVNAPTAPQDFFQQRNSCLLARGWHLTPRP